MSNLREAIENLVQLSPANVYECLPGPGAEGTASYTKGKCTNGSLGCLIGQGLHAIGYTIPADADEMMSLGELIEAAEPGAGDDEQWFYDLQGAQDKGMTWENALRVADQAEAA